MNPQISETVSIIIPTFNRVALLGETLESIRQQSFQDWECIVIDDGSTDTTEELLNFYCERDPRIKFFRRPVDRPKGANACRNFGFEKCKGKYINWFDSDDLMKPNFLEEKFKAFTEETDIVISKNELITHKGNSIRIENRTRYSENLLEDFICLKVSWYLPDPMYRRKFLTGKILFDEELHRGQDREFHIRRLLENPVIKFIEESLAFYRQSTVSISNDFSVQVVKSHYEAVERQMILVLSKIKSQDLFHFYLKDQIKKYPYLWQVKGITMRNYRMFYRFSSFSRESLKWLIKYSLAVISFKLFGKGYYFLKG